MTRANDGTGGAAPDGGETPPALSGARLFPIGFGLGAIAALALFFGYRAVVPEGDGATPDGPVARSASPGTMTTDDAPPAVSAASVAKAATPAVDAADGAAERIAETDASPDAPAYAATGADVAAATAEAPAFAGLEELASLNGMTGTGIGARIASPDTASGLSVGSGLPSIDDPATSDLFGGPVMMVSSTVPRVIMLADGTSLVPGERLPGGHRIVDIRRERILLERDGIEWRVSVP